ncbi:MAG: DUF1573 domain-containing protein [candidate division Zixibacteria bacterium]|nr:DUF1573 domain-containing protein [candidate division Zixibacteria bacterium]
MRLRSSFLLIAVIFAVHPFSQAGTPRIEFSERVWDFGRVPQQSTVSHTFWIKNVGTDTLKGISARVP